VTATEGPCPDGVAPEDVAAWAVDGEPHPDVELAQHVPACAVCRSVIAQVAPAGDVADTLRSVGTAPPDRVAERVAATAVGRIRAERGAVIVFGTFVAALARAARAAPDYLHGHRRAHRVEGKRGGDGP
jgi:hypothetical protein